MALCAFAAVVLLKLPPGYHIQAFERLDFVAFALLAPAVALMVAVLSQGYVRWWFDDAALAWMAMSSLCLFAAGLFLEYHRSNPLVKVRWLLQGPTIRFTIGALLLRFITAEQNYGMVSLLRTLGMGPDQMQPLFVVVLLGTLCGIALSALTFGPKTVIVQILSAIVLIGMAGFLDYGRTSLDRPADFMHSQFVLSVGAGMFMGPLILIGAMQALKHGADHIVTFAVLVGITQNLGGVLGSATLSTYQLHRQHEYSAAVVSHVNPTDPLVAERLRLQQHTVAALVTDPTFQAAQGTRQLGQAATREAQVRAYNDVFLFTGMLAMVFLAWSLVLTVRAAIRAKNAPAAANSRTASQSASL